MDLPKFAQIVIAGFLKLLSHYGKVLYIQIGSFQAYMYLLQWLGAGYNFHLHE